MEAIQTGAARKSAAAAVTSVDPDELIPAEKAAEMLRIRPQTLAAWRIHNRENRGPRWLKCGRRVFYRRADICAWLASQLSEVA